MKRRLTFALTLALAAGMLVLVPSVLGRHAVVGPIVEVIDDNNNVDGGLANVGIFGLRQQQSTGDQVARVVVDLYCERMELKVGGA